MRLMFPRVAHIGLGSFNKLGEETARLGKRAMIVAGMGSLRKSGFLDRAVQLMKAHGVESVVSEGVPAEPDLQAVDVARKRLRENSCDIVAGIGGGSVIDVAKAAAALAAADAPTAEFFYGRQIPAGGLPVAAVPTTSGTGAEATRNSVLTDHNGPEKKSIRGDSFVPTLVIVDGEPAACCPPSVTANSGMDALCQAIEAFFSNQARPATDALAVKAIELISGSIVRAYENGGDRQTRMRMAEGSYLAGIAFANARLGAVHGLAHPIGAMFDLPHGLVCAVLLPVVLKLNWDAIRTKAEYVSDYLSEDPVRYTRSMLRKLDLPEQFSFSPDESQLETIIDYALKSGSSRANPVGVNREYVCAAMTAACSTP